MSLKAKNPRLSMSIDPATGFVGKVPGFQSIKNTYKEKVKPFFSPMNADKGFPGLDSANKTNVNWAKVTDPNQSIRILDSIQLQEGDYNDDELLGGTTKAAGMMFFKLKADAAILDQI